MAEENDKKTKRYTGTVKYLSKHGLGYIIPDIEVFVTPFSLSSTTTTIKEGDRVEFGMKFRDTNPNFEAIDVTPIETQRFNCKIFGHSTDDCRRRHGNSISRVCKASEFSNVGNSNSNSNAKSLVCVKRKEDVKKVEEVEDCFILDFDPYENNGNNNDVESDTKKKKKGKGKGIVCVKNVEDVKKVEEVEDCFISEFDPYENTSLTKFNDLSLCDDDKDDDVFIFAEKGKVACRDYPHPRHLCVTHPFKSTSHEIHCEMCYCYVCEKPAPCKSWTDGSTDPCLRHCDATIDIPDKELRKPTN